MTQKESTIYILDLSKNLTENSSFLLKQITQTLSELISKKLLFSTSKEEISILLINSGKNSNPDNLELFLEFEPPKLNHLRKIKYFYEQINNNPLFFNDCKNTHPVLNAITSAVDSFLPHTLKGNCLKNIIVFTSTTPDLQNQETGITHLDTLLKNNQINAKVFDFSDFKDPSNLLSLQTSPSERTSFPPFNDFGLKVLSFKVLLSQLQSQSMKTPKNTSKFKGHLEISPINRISVLCLRKTVKDTGFQFSKYSKNTPFNPSSISNSLQNNSSFVHPEDPYLTPLDSSQILKNYKYGQQMIPLSTDVEQSLKQQHEKSLKLLCFIDQHKIPRHTLMGSVDAVLPNEDLSPDLRAFNALVAAMLESKKAALAKFVARQNDIPKLAALFPRKKIISASQKIVYLLYLVELPTIEDIREFNFGSSLKSSLAQQAVAGKLIDVLDLCPVTLTDLPSNELIRPSNTLNPVNELFTQYALELGLSSQPLSFNPDQLEERLIQNIFPERNSRKKVKGVSSQIQESFEFHENELRPENSEKVFWKDLLRNKELEEQRAAEKDKNPNDEPVIRDLSKHHPVSDFRDMLRFKKEDLVENAIKQMQELIMELVKTSVDGSFFSRALEYLSVLRDGCVQEDEPDLFNEFVRILKEKMLSEHGFEGFLEEMQKNGVALISSAESHQSLISPEIAVRFVFEKSKRQKEQKEQNKEPHFDISEMFE